MLTPNESELAAIAGPGDPEAAARSLLAGGPPGRAVVVTLGAAGVLVVRDALPAVAVPAARVVPVDTTGAGDTFNGALAAGLAAGLPLVDACRAGRRGRRPVDDEGGRPWGDADGGRAGGPPRRPDGLTAGSAGPASTPTVRRVPDGPSSAGGPNGPCIAGARPEETAADRR